MNRQNWVILKGVKKTLDRKSRDTGTPDEKLYSALTAQVETGHYYAL